MDEARKPWALTKHPWLLSTALLTYVVGMVAVACAAFVHDACFGRYGSEPPERGPLTHYCDAVNPTHPWLSFTIPPILIMLLGGYLLRRRGWMALCLAAVLCVVAIANAVVATHLHHGYFGA